MHSTIPSVPPSPKRARETRAIDEDGRVGKPGIDFARTYHGETRDQYAFHLFLGHHGYFSLMPIWLLSLGSPGWSRSRYGPLPSL